MSMVDELAQALEAQFPWLVRPSDATGGVEGNLFTRDLPDAPDSAVALYQYGGQNPERALGATYIYEKPRLQVMVRDFDPSLAESRAYDIMRFLNSINGDTVSGTYYVDVTSLGSPGEVGPDPKGRQKVSTNYQVWKEYSA